MLIKIVGLNLFLTFLPKRDLSLFYPLGGSSSFFKKLSRLKGKVLINPRATVRFAVKTSSQTKLSLFNNQGGFQDIKFFGSVLFNSCLRHGSVLFFLSVYAFKRKVSLKRRHKWRGRALSRRIRWFARRYGWRESAEGLQEC